MEERMSSANLHENENHYRSNLSINDFGRGFENTNIPLAPEVTDHISETVRKEREEGKKYLLSDRNLKTTLYEIHLDMW